ALPPQNPAEVEMPERVGSRLPPNGAAQGVDRLVVALLIPQDAAEEEEAGKRSVTGPNPKGMPQAGLGLVGLALDPEGVGQPQTSVHRVWLVGDDTAKDSQTLVKPTPICQINPQNRLHMDVIWP